MQKGQVGSNQSPAQFVQNPDSFTSKDLTTLDGLFSQEGGESDKTLLAFRLFLALPVPVAVARGCDRQLLYANIPFQEIFGPLSPDASETDTLDQYFETGVWTVIKQALWQYGALDNYELQLYRDNGTCLWSQVSLKLVDLDEDSLILSTFRNITYPKQIEQILHESQRTFSHLIGHIPGIIYRFRNDAIRSCEYISEGCLTLLGYAPREFLQTSDLSVHSLIDPQDRQRVKDTIAEALAHQSTYAVEYRLSTRSGTQKWVWEQGSGLFTPHGELMALEGFISDITERKRAEEEVKLLQKLTRAIAEAPNFHAALELVLSQVCQTTGLDFAEAWLPNSEKTALNLSSAWYTHHHQEAYYQFRQSSYTYQFGYGQGLPGLVWSTQTPQWFADVSSDGHFLRRQLAQTCNLGIGLGIPILAQEQVVAVLVFFQVKPTTSPPPETVASRFIELISTLATQLGGIMQRKQTEAALQESQRQLSSLINALPGIFFQAKNAPGWPMTYLSEGCHRLTGYSRKDLITQNYHSFDQIIHTEDLGQVLTVINNSVTQQKPYVVEYRIQTKTGEEKWVWEKGHGVYDDSGEILGIEGFITDITERKTAEQALHSYAGELQALFAAMTDIILVLDAHGRYLKVAPTNPSRLYLPREKLEGKQLGDIFPPKQAQFFLGYIREAIATGNAKHNVEYHLELEGQQVWFSATISPTPDKTVLWVARDITEYKQSQEALRQAEAKYRSIFENAVEGIFQTTPDGHYISANPALAKIYGYETPEEMIEGLTDIEHQLYVNPEQRQGFVQLMQEQDAVVGFESQIYQRDGTIIWIAENARAVRDERGNLLYYEGMVVDITEQKQVKEELHQRAYYDTLTGLPNRALFRLRLSHALQNARQGTPEHPYRFAVLFLDLDRFKVVNDSLGHLIGDQLLIAIARRLEQCIRIQDVVARLGGDEFTILLNEINSLKIATQVAERIERELRSPFYLGGYQVFTGVSIGIVLCSHPSYPPSPHQFSHSHIPLMSPFYEDPDDLLRDADTALYQAKAQGKGRYELFDPTMHQSAVTQLEIETELRQALELGQFMLLYDPIISLKTGQLQGFEALLRWDHPEKGLLEPQDFLEIAEESGLILPLGQWMLKTACQQLQYWCSLLPSKQRVLLHLNISRKQFLQSDLIEQIDEIAQSIGLDRSLLRLEITENIWQKNIEAVQLQLQKLQDRQIQLCLDEFGLGYSCLENLQQFSIYSLKIESALIRAIPEDRRKTDITHILLMLAESLGLEAIAQTVETPQQLQKLQEFGCTFAQGPLFSPLLSSQDSIERIQQQIPWF
ncbi:PAS domain S-box protein [Spirulina sp. CS-785/01]|uniref:PAS domain S-box protein n=1 Tax=Spirulina sp. CS-785/01 TaxID=3021716 RepID=UPI00232F2F08|nr:PAS domain S-box protein [Spirulina sp. CS-785/01]MDB9311927.1 PAS domain S-box protein [Spirulina sp. CS-785/01]